MKPISLDGEPIDSCGVKTYVLHHTSPKAPRIKVSCTAERYAFNKHAFAAGGEGRLFAARDLATQKPYCIKEIRLKEPKQKGKKGGSIVDWTDIRERAVTEVEHARITSRSFGPIRLFTNNKYSKLYVVQNVMSGRIMTAIDKMESSVPRPAAVRYLSLVVAQDVKSIHDAGILHFDIKPDNICYDRDKGDIELLDFGISVRGTSGFAAGSSAQYSCVEQVKGERLNKTADIFSLGATFGEFALGRPLLGRVSQGVDLEFFTARDLEQVANGTCSNRNLVAYHQRYTKDLNKFDSELAVLIADMMNIDSSRRPGTDTVIQRLQAMQPSDEHRSSMGMVWATLPNFDLEFERRLRELDQGLRKIDTEQLKPIKTK